MAEEKQELLNLLNSYGQQFMSSFESSIFASKRKDTPEAGPSSSRKKRRVEDVPELEEESEEEWLGFGGSRNGDESNTEDEEDISEGTRVASSCISCIHLVILDETRDGQKGKRPALVVFSETVAKSSAPPTGSKAQLKAFMVGGSRNDC